MSETFTLQPDFCVTRDSDGEVMANYDPENRELTYTHHSRERNFGDEIRAVVEDFQANGFPDAPGDTMEQAPASNPNPNFRPPAESTASAAGEVPREEPPRHVQMGTYTKAHLLYDLAKLPVKKFRKKWGGRMSLSTTRMMRENPDYFREVRAKVEEALVEPDED